MRRWPPLLRIWPLAFVLGLPACAVVQPKNVAIDVKPVIETPQIPVFDRLQKSLDSSGFITEQTDRGLVVYLPSLYFEFESADLKLEAEEKIRLLAEAINQEYVSDRKIAVEGHTDSVGDADYNLYLSQLRAESVADHLVFSKVSTDRIETAWFGESAPKTANRNADGSDNPVGRSANRRVEFIILNPSD